MKAQLKADLDLKKATVTDKDLNKAIESRYVSTESGSDLKKAIKSGSGSE